MLGLRVSPRTTPFHQNAAFPKRETLENAGDDDVEKLVAENALIVIGRRGCCMSHVVKRLLLGLGVNPLVYDVDEDREEGVVQELVRINVSGVSGCGSGEKVALPAVYVGGKLFGGLDKVMSTHISGELVPILKEVGALWL
ncbi:PREDICTED: glutaredoxin-C9-like [Tarenaya hassleriana]|uniref:glutaredoxin-C9-like n=1 Tax=Tarenaya hassleriana TaxID=28532 RepID=UPI00053C5737|nr:PREDICTED: glutaredoxin-C9-like [Tarenaya hassleriana]